MFFVLERLSVMLKKLFDADITGDVHEELVKASANGRQTSMRTRETIYELNY
jgi:hypothetical protein